MDIEGIIIQDLGEKSGIAKSTGNPWKKHEWVLETVGQYPRKVKFDVFGERADTLTFETGKTYVISVDLESRCFNDNWYTDVRAFAARMSENQGGVVTPPPSVSTQTNPVNPYAKTENYPPTPQPSLGGETSVDFIQGSQEDDLPF